MAPPLEADNCCNGAQLSQDGGSLVELLPVVTVTEDRAYKAHKDRLE